MSPIDFLLSADRRERAIVRGLAVRPRWFVAKGGITSSDLAARALGLRRAEVLGQALPGVPAWRNNTRRR